MRKTLARAMSIAPDSIAARSVQQGKSPWTDAVHLLWTVWVFLVPVFDSFTWQWFWLTVVSYPLFVLLYAGSCLASKRRYPRCVVGMLAMSYVLLPWYGSALVYFPFACVMLGGCRVSLRYYLTMVALLNAALFAEAVGLPRYPGLLHYSWQSLTSVAVLSFVVGLVIYAERSSEEQRAQLRLSHEEIRRLAAIAERERIGRDLHDLLGHTLSLITLKLELSRKLFDRDQEAARRELSEAERVARHALAEVRAAVTGIRATDLAAELGSARLLLESSRVDLEYGELPLGLPAELERGLALILREAATNIARHSQASRARIAIARDGHAVQLEVTDNGRGGIDGDGNGLCGMRERVRALRGSLSIASPRGRGTRLLARLPWPPASELPAAPAGAEAARPLQAAGRALGVEE